MRSRGQAYVETAIFLPLFLLLLYGAMWVMQVSVLNERGQIAVRYSGLVSNESTPYSSYSFYTLYANVAGNSQSAPTTCSTPAVDAYINSSANGAFPGPSSAPFWQPDSNALTTATCTTSRVSVTGGSLTSPVLLVNTDAQAAVQKTTSGAFGKLANITTTSAKAELNYFNTPDLAATLQCYTELHDTISASLATLAPSPSPVAVPTALSGTTSTAALTDSC